MKRQLLLLSVVALACEDPAVFVAESTAEQVFVQDPEPKVDILWVIDSSNSMEAEQIRAVNQASTFFGRLVQESLDFHVGVISSDVRERGMLRPYRGEPIPGCSNCRFLTPRVSCNNPEVDVASTPSNVLISECGALEAFRQMATVGIEGIAIEQSFEHVRQALGLVVEDDEGLPAFDATTGQILLRVPPENDGFVREDADLMIIFMSDEDEGFKEDAPDVFFYRRLFSALKSGTEKKVIFGAIVGWGNVDDPTSELPTIEGYCDRYSELFDDVRANDDQGIERREVDLEAQFYCQDASNPADSNGRAEPGLRYIDLACASDGVVANICAADYQEAFGRLAERVIQLSRSVALDRGSQLASIDDPQCLLDCRPDGSIQDVICVTVETPSGNRVDIRRDPDDGWTWSEAASTVSFLGDYVPPAGSRVTIRYRLQQGGSSCI